MVFNNRQEAGVLLAEKLKKFSESLNNPIVYALPRGGVIIGREVAKALSADLDLIITRKIGHPYNNEYAIGAIGEFSQPVLNQAEASQLDPDWLKLQVSTQKQEIKRRRKTYLPGKQVISPKNRTVIIVDDGLATGLTMKSAIADIKALGGKDIIVAVPVAPRDVVEDLKSLEIKVVTVYIPSFFMSAIGAYYHEFEQVSDQKVVELLAKSTK